jgi:hypothetical protein
VTEHSLDACGVVYALAGTPYFREARTSIRSLRAVHPELPVAVAFSGERDRLAEVMDGIPGLTLLDATSEAAAVGVDMDDPMERSRGVKVNVMTLSPFRFSLFLDSDTYVRAPLGPLFAPLREGDALVVTTNEPVVSYPKAQYAGLSKDARPASGTQLHRFSNPSFFNSGVFAFSDAVTDAGLARRWIEVFAAQIRATATSNWSRLCDQKAFNAALTSFPSGAQAVRSNTIWNAQCKILKELYLQGRWDDIAIIHCKMVHHLGTDARTLIESSYIGQFWMSETERAREAAAANEERPS